MSFTVFIDLNRLLVNTAYKSTWRPKLWNGFRLCAIDGTSIRLPNEEGITSYFGVHNGKPNQAPCAMGMASVFYDVLNKIVIDSELHPRLTPERDCAQIHLSFADPNDLILFDRGYVSFWLYSLLLTRKINFCMRAKTNQDKRVKDFIASGKKETIVTYEPGQRARQICHEKSLSIAPIKLRLIRVDLPNEVEVLVTSLMDETCYPATVFKNLYHLRWGIEENYKRLKQWCEIENFSGKSALSVQQDFYAKIVASNLTTLLTLEAQEKVDIKTRNRALNYQINYAQALSKMKHRIVDLLCSKQIALRTLIKETVHYISLTIEAIRDGRSNPRNLKNIKNDIHFAAYKSAL